MFYLLISTTDCLILNHKVVKHLCTRGIFINYFNVLLSLCVKYIFKLSKL